MPPDESCDVWPDNWVVKEVAVRMVSQLNVGVTGMRYEALPAVLDLLKIPAEDRLAVFDDLRVIMAELVRQLRESG